MTTDSSDTNPVYCPRCFRVVKDRRVFCFFCGQFVHAHVPADSRTWDSRLSDLTAFEPGPPEERTKIEIPDDRPAHQQNQSVVTNKPANDHPNPVYTTDESDSRDKSRLDIFEPAAANRFTETSVVDPIISEKSDIEQDEKPRQDHQSTT